MVPAESGPRHPHIGHTGCVWSGRPALQPLAPRRRDHRCRRNSRGPPAAASQSSSQSPAFVRNDLLRLANHLLPLPSCFPRSGAAWVRTAASAVRLGSRYRAKLRQMTSIYNIDYHRSTRPSCPSPAGTAASAGKWCGYLLARRMPGSAPRIGSYSGAGRP
jgi:hypothetical protein